MSVTSQLCGLQSGECLNVSKCCHMRGFNLNFVLYGMSETKIKNFF